MAGSMDERVVSMEFDNKSFEKNVKSSIKTIDDLKESLNFDDSVDSLDELDNHFKKFGKQNVFKDLDTSCTSLRKGMLTLGDSTKSLIGQFAEITKVTAMFEMATQAVRKLESSIKQFTVQPIYEGYSKYNTKISSIKTISNATGLEADKVNESLERLNWFTDETSASFGEMVNNIGKFTSVGKGLNESITAMEGIATWGYHSGANVAEINRAMYNLSQALGTGSVKLIDWKSIENAGMATKEFKEQAIAAAEAAGTLKRKNDKLYTAKGNTEVNASNFNSTLAKGWFTSDVLMKTLEKYGGFADTVKKYQEEHPQYELAADAMKAMDLERQDKEISLYQKNMDAMLAASGKTEDELTRTLERIRNLEDKKGEKDYEARKKELDKLRKTLGLTELMEITDTKKRQKALSEYAKKTGLSVEKLTELLDELGKCEESLGEKAFKSSQQAKSFTEAIDATKDAVSTGWMNTFQTIFGGLDDSISLWTDVTEILWELFASGAEGRNNALTHWAETFNGRDDLWGEEGLLHTIMDTIIELKGLLSTSFKDVFFPHLSAALDQATSQADAVNYMNNGLRTLDQIKVWREGDFYGRKLKDFTTSIKEFGLAFQEFFTNEQNTEKISQIFRGVFSVVQLGASIIGGFFKSVGDVIKKSGVLQDILNLAARIGEKIQGIAQKISSSGFFTELFGRIGNNIVWFYNLLKKWVGQITSFLQKTGIIDSIKNWFEGIYTYFVGGKDKNGKKVESEFFKSFSWLGKIKEWLEKIDLEKGLTRLLQIIQNFGEIWSTFKTALSGEKLDKKALKDSGMDSWLTDLIEKVWGFGNKLSGIGSFFKGIYDSIAGWLETSGILPKLREWWEGIKAFFENIGQVWDVFVNGKKIDPKTLDKKQIGILNTVGKFITKVKRLFTTLKGWFDTAVAWVQEKWGVILEWLETSGILPKVRSIWKTITDFFSNIGLLWDIFVHKNGTFDPSELTEDQLNIVSRIYQFVTTIKEKFEWIKNKFFEIKDKVVGWLEESGVLPTLRQWWTEITGWFESLTVPGGEDGPLQSVKDFFAGLYGTVSGWFGGGALPTVEKPAQNQNKPGETAKEAAKEMTEQDKQTKTLWDRVGDMIANMKNGIKQTTAYQNIYNAFHKDGKLDLSGGFITSVAEGFSFVADVLGSVPWEKGFQVIADFFVKGINALNNALKDVHIDNIMNVLGKIVGWFNSGLWAITIGKWGASLGKLFTTIRSIAKKGKDKDTLEQVSDLLTSIGSMLLQIGIAVALVAGSMWVISTIIGEGTDKDMKRWNAVKGFFIGLGALIVGFTLVLAFLNPWLNVGGTLTDTLKAIGAMFIQIGVAIALIVGSIWLMSTMVQEGSDGNYGLTKKAVAGLWVVAGIMGTMLVAIVAISWITKKIGAINMTASIGVFAGMAIVLGAITICILLLQGVDWNKAWVGAAMLGGVILLLGIAMKLMNGLKIDGKVLGIFVTFALILAAVSLAFILLKDADVNQLMGIAGAFVTVILGLAAAAAIVSSLDPVAVTKGSLAFGALITILALAASISAYVISAAAQSVIDRLVKIISSLGAAGISAETVNKDKILEAINMLTDIVAAFDKVTGCDTRVALQVAQDTRYFTNRLSMASRSAETVNIGAFKEIFGEDGTGGIMNVITTGISGIKDPGFTARTLGWNLEALGSSLKLIGRSGAELSDELDNGITRSQGITAVKESLGDIKEIVGAVAEMTTTTIGENGEVREIDLTTFAEGIANIGSALQIYNTAVSGIVPEADNATASGDLSGKIRSALETVLSTLSVYSPNDSRITEISEWSEMAKDDKGATSRFALGLVAMSNALAEFSKSAKDFDEANSNKAIAALQMLADIYERTDLRNAGQYSGMISEVSDWQLGQDQHYGSSFANSIVGMGTAMKEFGDSVSGIKYGSVMSAIVALKLLQVIYENVQASSTAISYFSGEFFGLFKVEGQSAKTDTNAPAETLGSFGEGIGLLGQSLAEFNTQLTGVDREYNPDKVDQAVKVLQSLSDMQIALRKSKLDADWWTVALFDENLGTFSSNISGLGAILTQFSRELSGTDTEPGFTLDANSKQWTSITSVLLFMTTISERLGKISPNYNTTEVSKVAYTIGNLAADIKELTPALVEFTKAMNGLDLKDASKDANDAMRMGNWDEGQWKKLTAMINQFKSIAITFYKSGLKENNSYRLKDFGYDIDQMFQYLNGWFNGGDMKNVSSLAEFMKKITFTENVGINVSTFTRFIDNVKKIAETAGILHSMNVDQNDIEHMCSLISNIISIDTSGFTGETFNLDGVFLATEFLSGFLGALSGMAVATDETDTSLSGAMTDLVLAIEDYQLDFYNAGFTAGQQYASGFRTGLGQDPINPTGTLTPIVHMGADGSTKNGIFSSTLQNLNAGVAARIGEVMTQIENRLTGGSVNSGNSNSNREVVSALSTISSQVSQLSSDVANLKVYIDKGTLVGTITPDIDRVLGARSRLHMIS